MVIWFDVSFPLASYNFWKDMPVRLLAARPATGAGAAIGTPIEAPDGIVGNTPGSRATTDPVVNAAANKLTVACVNLDFNLVFISLSLLMMPACRVGWAGSFGRPLNAQRRADVIFTRLKPAIGE